MLIQGIEEGQYIQGLGQVTIGSQLEHLIYCGVHRIGTQNENGNVLSGLRFPELLKYFPAMTVGKVEIQDDQIGLVFFGHANAFHSMRG